jgi:ELWxxDGT repeat protein
MMRNLLTQLRRSWWSRPGRRPRRLPLGPELLENRLVPSDATGTVLVKDFVPGSDSSGIYQMADLNGTLLLSVADGGSGFQGIELWKSNGTTTDIVAGVEALSPFTVIGGTAFFAGEDATTPDFELFKTDGTAAGTVWIDPGGNMSHPGDLTNVNGTLFFRAYDPARGFELWKSDGTAAGTVLVKDINPGSGWSFPVQLTNVNGTLFFVASDGTVDGSGLWKSDGTAAGTVFVKSVYATNLTDVNGKLFFTGDDGKTGAELWASDGTARGTKMVKDINSGSTNFPEYYGHHHFKVPNSSNPSGLVNVNGTLFFVADDGTHGRELWKSNGTAKGTVLVSDIQPGAGSSFFTFPSVLTNRDGTLFFGADDGTHGSELWKSDGTAAGTMLVKDINPGSAESYPALLTLSGGHLFFSADDGVHGRELWDPPVASGSISGNVFEDLADNGVGADDPPIAGRPVNLFRDDGDGTFEPGTDVLVARQQTRADGGYDFRRLAAGNYFVQQELPPGWVQTVPADNRVDVIIRPADAGPTAPERNDTLATATATGLSSAAPGTYLVSGEIGDNNLHVLDVDLFRVQAKAGDVIRADVDAEGFGSPLDATLRLFDAAGVQVMASTDIGDASDPYFQFVVQATGTYYVGVSGAFNADYDPTVEGSGTLAVSTGAYTLQIDVGALPAAGPVAVTLASDEARGGVDLASSRLGSISGRVFEDLDGDGVHDANEPGLDGWRVTLRHGGGLFSATVSRSVDLNQDGKIDPTRESGIYSFDQLTPGDYFTGTLFAVGRGPAGWTQVSPSLDTSVLPRIGSVSSGPDSGPQTGLVPDLTVDLANGLWDRFQLGNMLYFGQATPNLGPGPMELRAGADLGNGTQIVNQRIYLDPSLTTYYEREAGTFTFHPEHNHIHFDDYATYALRQALPDGNGDGVPEVGAVVAGGQKRSFCLVDVAPYDLTLPNAAQEESGFGCGTAQRISVGWEDIYDPFTIGQQIDVSGLADGQYWLEATVDPDNRLLESNENNNTGRALVSIGLGGPDAPFGQHGVSLRSGQVVTDKDFANFRTISISGQVFNDKNANGRQDNKEHGLDGWTVFIDLNGDGVLNNPEGNGLATALAKEPWAITDNQGNYAFAGRGPGTYRLRVVPRVGWTQTTPNPAPFEARSGQNVSGVNFGLVQAGALAAEETGGGTTRAITTDQITPLLAQALARWQAAGVDTSALGAVDVRVSDFGGRTLGLAAGHTIWLDADAAGWGWFVDKTPWDDSEFTTPGDQGEWHRMDLLTVLEHEIGHLLGHGHEADGVMQHTLTAGTRRTVRPVLAAVTDEPGVALAGLEWAEERPWLGGRRSGRGRKR